MKKILILLLITFFSSGLKAQQTPIEEIIAAVPADAFVLKNLFSPADATPTEAGALSQVLESYQLMMVNDATLNSMVAEDIPELKINIMIDGHEETLLLVKNNVVDAGTAFTTQQNTDVKEPADYYPGVYYYGVIKGHPNSVVGISFFQTDIIGVISTENGNYVLGKIGVVEGSAKYILYNDRKMLQHSNWTCTEPAADGVAIPEYNVDLGNKPTSADKCVRIYVEVDHKMHLNLGNNFTKTFNYATGLFNLVSTLYQNESITMACSGVNVWTATDPYITETTTSGMLNKFSNAMNASGFDGSLAHLLSGRNLGGGIAWLDVLCGSNYLRTAVSTALVTSLASLPTYSWNVNCVTHEIGHNLGSRHTHACAWNGNNTAIDACGPYYGYVLGISPPILFEGPGNCGSGYMPTSEGGTIMSYCHLGPAGIKFSNGFGPQPGNLIRNKVSNASCLLQCDRRCPVNVTFPNSILTFAYSRALTESQTWIRSSGTAIINPSVTVKLDANPVNGYVLLNPGLYAAPNASGTFIAQALDGCAAGIPQRPANPTPVFTPEKIKESALTAYPNPATNQVTIKVNVQMAKEYRIDIIDINSRVIKSIVSKVDLNTVDISEFNQGLYLVRANINGRDYSCKFLKTN